MLKLFANSYGAIASREAAATAFIPRLVSRLREQNMLPGPVRMAAYTVTRTAMVLVRMITESRTSYLLTLPLDERAERRLQRSIDQRAGILGLPLGREVRATIGLVAGGVFEDVPFKLDLFCPAARASTYAQAPVFPRIVDGCVDWLRLFHGSAASPVRFSVAPPV